MMPAPVGQPPLSAVDEETRATFAELPLIAIAPVASADGRGEPHGEPEQLAPAPSWTRKCCPGLIVPERFVGVQVVPAADAYCTLQPVRSTAEFPRLKIS